MVGLLFAWHERRRAAAVELDPPAVD